MRAFRASCADNQLLSTLGGTMFLVYRLENNTFFIQYNTDGLDRFQNWLERLHWTVHFTSAADQEKPVADVYISKVATDLGAILSIPDSDKRIVFCLTWR
jgi:hypothetical protein